MDPYYIKVLLERIMSLEFKETNEAKHFFREIRDMMKNKETQVKKDYDRLIQVTEKLKTL